MPEYPTICIMLSVTDMHTNTMTKLLFTLLAITWCSISSAAELKLVCEDTSETARTFRKDAPSLGIDIYSVDSSASTVRQLAGKLKDMRTISAEINEAEIRLVQSGYINQPEITETFITVISRVSGRWIRHPHYLDSKGMWVSGTALEKLARSLNLWGTFFGIRQGPDEGECKPDSRKF